MYKDHSYNCTLHTMYSVPSIASSIHHRRHVLPNPIVWCNTTTIYILYVYTDWLTQLQIPCEMTKHAVLLTGPAVVRRALDKAR